MFLMTYSVESLGPCLTGEVDQKGPAIFHEQPKCGDTGPRGKETKNPIGDTQRRHGLLSSEVYVSCRILKQLLYRSSGLNAYLIANK